MNITISFSNMSSSILHIIGGYEDKQMKYGTMENSTVGQIFMEWFTIHIFDSFFNGKSRPRGTLITLTHSFLHISNSTFWGNQATGEPIVVNASNFSKVTVQNSTFMYNDGDKGTILIANGSYISIKDSLIAENNVPMSNFHYSTITVLANSSASITQSKLFQNTAYKGGVILGLNRSSISILRSIARDNQACFGGLIAVELNSNLTILESRVVHNAAIPQVGYIDHECSNGAVSARESKVTLMDSVIEKNTAKYYSGAIGVKYRSELIIINCTLSENHARYYSGGISIWLNSSATVMRSSFLKNHALQKGAIGVNSYSLLYIVVKLITIEKPSKTTFLCDPLHTL